MELLFYFEMIFVGAYCCGVCFVLCDIFSVVFIVVSYITTAQ